MRAVLPGKPQAKLQAVCTAQWDGRRTIVYISGNALVILGGADNVIQTIYQEGEDLEAVAIDEATGKIATCAGSSIFLYRPYGWNEGALKWSLETTLSLISPEDIAYTLSWGSSEDLLVGSSCLTLFRMSEEQPAIWSRQLSSSAKFAHFSYDSTLIASTGKYDRLMKIWRRLSYGSDNVQFDFTYLPHPTTITGIHWRRPFHRDQTIDNVLYTLCADNVLRIWAATDPHGLQMLQLWAQIDLQESIKPRMPSVETLSHIRYCFIIDSRDFTYATERAVQGSNAGDKQTHALEHLIEVAKRSPEVCVVLDDKGHMSAWGLENVGSRARKTTSIFNISHIEALKLHFPQDVNDEQRYMQFYNFCDQPNGEFTLLAHYFDGRIEWLEGRVDEIFDPSPRPDRYKSKAFWTGHASPIKKIVRTASGKALISRTSDNEGLVWKQNISKDGTSLIRQSTIKVPNHIHRTCVLAEGDFALFLHHESISLWDTRAIEAILVSSCAFELEGKPLCLITLPGMELQKEVIHVASISSKLNGITWEIRLPLEALPDYTTNGTGNPYMQEFCKFDLGIEDDLAYVLPVDPAGSASVISGFIDTFAKDIAISYTNAGILKSWTAKVDPKNASVEWLVTSTVETGIENPSLASGSSIRKTALVNAEKSVLTIWDTRGAQLEFELSFGSYETIQDLDWTSTPDDQSILAVGFPHKVILLAQLRYDYLNAGPSWASIREIWIRDLTPHPIGDSIWLGSGNLVVGAGNQFWVYDKEVKISDTLVTNLRLPSHQSVSHDLFNIVTRLNGPLPVFHPQFLAQCILSGRPLFVQKILVRLHKALKFFVEGDEIESFLGIPLLDFYDTQSLSNSSAKGLHSSSYDDDSEPETLTEDIAANINEKLTKIGIPQLSGQEQIDLADIVECVATVEKHRRSIDDNASRYLLFFRLHALRKSQANADPINISWREIVWAYHSDSQEILVDLVSRQFQGRMMWTNARESGMFMWLRDHAAVRAQFEIIARNQYTKSDTKDPTDCSLYYMALKKKAVLLGLWRMAGWNREQVSTQKFLANNFSIPRWKTAALKNAYALLGKRRFEYAAAFFLLADCLKDAVNVCLNQLGDLQLAIAITRVYEGDDGPVLKELLEEQVLPLAAREGARWLATWAFWMLNRRDMAVRALISPVYTLIESPESPGLQARLFLADDPALVVLYKQLREKTLQTLRGASKISPRAEWDFITHNARLYDRMGCDFLALELVRNWEFLHAPQEARRSASFEGAANPRLSLRRRGSMIVADLPNPKLAPELQSVGVGGGASGVVRPQSVFEEPDANALLDGFGF
ncbi:MAG: regulator of (H+)-ATPase in vacuolar membrane [Trizodia sp. TS-e1964]|nr:MAG: regulator of (H+)-ATPase in vacuolar membrane [Trizodia sp. TS-e1964]